MTKRKGTSARSAAKQLGTPSLISKKTLNLNWFDLDYWKSQYWEKTQKLVTEAVKMGVNITPGWKLAFRPIFTTRMKDTRVFFLGREPSILPTAKPDGFAFSDAKALTNFQELPRESQVILQALDHAYPGFERPRHASLRNWAKQGVFLWNALPISGVGSPVRFMGSGFEELTIEMIQTVHRVNPKVLFVMHDMIPDIYKKAVPNGATLIVPPTIPAYSGMTHGKEFIEFNVFSKINDYLLNKNSKAIDWRIK